MIFTFRRGLLFFVAIAAGVLALTPALANAPFKTRDLATGVRNPNGVPSVMKLDSAGRPVFALFSGYEFHPDQGTIEVIRCADTTCSSSTRNVVAEAVPADTSLGLTLDASDNPLVAYSYDVPGFVSVRAAHCVDPACAVPVSVIYLASGTAPSLQVLDVEFSGGFPVIALDHPTEYALLWRCDDMACNGASGGVLSYTPAPGSDYSTTFGTDGFPIVSFQTADGLVAAVCSDDGCTSFNVTIRPIDTSDPGVGQYSTVEIHPVTGFPVFAYGDEDGDLKIAFCSDAGCVTPPTTQTLATSGNQDRGLSLAFEGSNPVVVSRFLDGSGDAIRWIRCEDAACTTTTSYIVDGPHASIGSSPPSLAFTAGADHGHRIGFFQRESGTLKLLYAPPAVANGVDVDCNGDYEGTDALIILRALAGLEEDASALAPCDLDVNNDANVDILDVLWMRQLAAGLITP